MRRLQATRHEELNRQRAPKRKVDEPTEDGSRDPRRGVRTTPPPPIPRGATVASTAASSSQGGGQKCRAKDPPDDPRLDGQGQAEVVLDTVDKRYARKCAPANAALHRASSYIGTSGNIDTIGWAAQRAPGPAPPSASSNFRRSRGSTSRRASSWSCRLVLMRQAAGHSNNNTRYTPQGRSPAS